MYFAFAALCTRKISTLHLHGWTVTKHECLSLKHQAKRNGKETLENLFKGSPDLFAQFMCFHLDDCEWHVPIMYYLFSSDSEAMGFLLQTTMSCPCVLLRQVAGAGAGAASWLCTWWRQVAGAGAVSWLCTWWRQVAGAGAGAPVLVLVLGAGCRCWCWCFELAVHVVETGCRCWVPGAGAGAGALS